MALPALFVCLAFAAWLLVRDCKRRPSVSAAVWLPVLAVAFSASRAPADWLGMHESYVAGLPNTASGNLVDQIVGLAIILASLALVCRRGVRWNRLLASNTAIVLFYAFFILSPLWSAYPWDSLKRVLGDMTANIFVCAVMLSEKDPSEAIRAAYVRSACVLLPLSFLFIKYTFGRFGRAYDRGGEVMYTGVATQKNSLGEMAMLFSLVLVWDYLESRSGSGEGLGSRFGWDRFALLSGGVFLLLKSQSKTSLVCFVIGVLLLLRRERFCSRVFNRAVLAGALAVPLLFVSSSAVRSAFSPVLESVGRDASLTGRTDIWKHITWDTVNPLVGAGFWNFWGGPGGHAIQQAMGTDVPNAHDGYLDMYLDGGCVGLVLLFSLLFFGGSRLTDRLAVSGYHRFRYALLIVAIFANVSESNFGRPILLWFTTILVLLDFPRSAESHPEARELEAWSNGDAVVAAAGENSTPGWEGGE